MLYSVDGDGTDARVLARSVRTAEGYAGVTAEAPIRRPAGEDGCIRESRTHRAGKQPRAGGGLPVMALVREQRRAASRRLPAW